MIYRVESEENNPRYMRYRAVDSDGNYLTQSAVSGIRLYVYETETATETTNNGQALPVSSCVYDTLQSWDVDSTGYNVKIPLSGDYLPSGTKTYRVEVKITPTSGEAYYLTFAELKTVETYSA